MRIQSCHVGDSLQEWLVIVQPLNLFYLQLTNGSAVEQKGWLRVLIELPEPICSQE